MGDMSGLPKLLLIEDDRTISSALTEALANVYRIDVASTGKLGIYRGDGTDYAAILLDLNLPDLPGLAICQQLRERGAKAPILILTGEHNVLTKISLLDAGADDYLTKPFSLGELKARLRVLQRKTPSIAQPPLKHIVVGELELDTATYRVWRSGRPIQLRRKEFTLLACLMERAGTVVSRQALIQYAWQGHDEPWTNTIDVHIKYLRDKIDRPFDYPLIKTVHGFGYQLEVGAQKAVGTKECIA